MKPSPEMVGAVATAICNLHTRDNFASYIELAEEAIGAMQSEIARVREEALEEAAKIAEAMPWLVQTSPKHARGLKGTDVAAAIRAAKKK